MVNVYIRLIPVSFFSNSPPILSCTSLRGKIKVTVSVRQYILYVISKRILVYTCIRVCVLATIRMYVYVCMYVYEAIIYVVYTVYSVHGFDKNPIASRSPVRAWSIPMVRLSYQQQQHQLDLLSQLFTVYAHASI